MRNLNALGLLVGLLSAPVASGCGSGDSCDVAGHRVVVTCPPTPACGRCTATGSAYSFTLEPVPSSAGVYRDALENTFQLDEGECRLSLTQWGASTRGAQDGLPTANRVIRVTGFTGVYVEGISCNGDPCAEYTCTATVQ